MTALGAIAKRETCPHFRAEVSYRNKREAPHTKRDRDGRMTRYTFWRCPDCGAWWWNEEPV